MADRQETTSREVIWLLEVIRIERVDASVGGLALRIHEVSHLDAAHRAGQREVVGEVEADTVNIRPGTRRI